MSASFNRRRRHGRSRKLSLRITYEHASISLPVLQYRPEVVKFEVLVFCTGLVVELKPSNDTTSLVFRQESRFVGEIVPG
jgi:hypothetical protein